ncbi:hypothetical protein, partial [Burkholderia glumae]|uniref:hypothetical protein n=1 Tax=Burkholderia glumae TaxID=337 RepID=UPI003BA2F7F9
IGYRLASIAACSDVRDYAACPNSTVDTVLCNTTFRFVFEQPPATPTPRLPDVPDGGADR